MYRLPKRVKLGLALVIVGLVAAITLVHFRRRSEPRTWHNAVYVWQRRWAGEVQRAVLDAAANTTGFMVLAGEVSAGPSGLDAVAVRPDWVALASARTPVTLVLRADVSLASVLENGRAGEAAAFVEAFVAESARAAREAGVTVDGLQLDYDCPASKLTSYRQLLDALQRGGQALSITTLPSWLADEAFPELVRGLSYFVLQVHSLEKPTRVDEPIVLCRTERISGYVRNAAAVGVPFYVALPTYGYDVVFDASGAFVGLCAEQNRPVWEPDLDVRTVLADPYAMARVVRELRDAPAPGLKGIAWFRLPVATDRLNWTWPALRSVMMGRAPETSFVAELRTPDPGLFEVWVANTGQFTPPQPIAVSVEWTGAAVRAQDVLNGFRQEAGSEPACVRLEGPAPPPGEPIMAAWYRLAAVDGGEVALKSAKVEVRQ